MDSKPILILTNIALAAVLLYGFSTASTSSSLHNERQENCVTSPAPALVRGRLFGKHAITPATLRVNRPIGHSASTPVPPPVETPTHVVPAPQPVDTPSFAEPAPQPPLPVPAQSTDEKTAAPIPSAANNEGRDLCASAPQSSLIYYQRFENGTLVDEVGNFPDGTLVQGTIVPGKDGNALHVEARQPGAFVSMPTNALGPAGCIEFWAKIDNGAGLCTGTSFCPQFFSVFSDGDNRVGVDFCTNFGHNDCGATFHFWSLAFATTYKGCHTFSYDEILETDPADWHHYALVWDIAGLPITTPEGQPKPTGALFIDGELQLYNGRASTFTPETFLQRIWWLNKPMTLNFSYYNPPAASYAIDEFKIWNCPKVEF